MPPDPTVPPGASRVFVYGTLRRGDVRWPILERFVASPAPIVATVAGQLFDTGNGYPAAVFASGTAAETYTSLILGEVYTLAPDLVASGLARLDLEEGTVGGAYRRVTVTTTGGIAAWAYAYGRGLDLVSIPSGDWLAHRPLRSGP